MKHKIHTINTLKNRKLSNISNHTKRKSSNLKVRNPNKKIKDKVKEKLKKKRKAS
jgi:hypothetical protein